jgi:anti-anti-sigma regulatory factor
MKIKIDTKEKFTVLRLQETVFSENMADELNKTVLKLLQNEPVKNVTVDFANVAAAEKNALLRLPDLYMQTMENNASLVFFNIPILVKRLLNELDLPDVLNITPTESEASDMVHMEEMEREMD